MNCFFALALLTTIALQELDKPRMEYCGRHLRVLDLRKCEESGAFPTQFEFDIRYPPAWVEVPIEIPGMITAANRTWPECHVYRNNPAFVERWGYKAGLYFDLKYTDAEWPWHRCILDLALNDGSIFPLFDGQLYRASLRDSSLLLTRVADDCLPNDRPQKSSLIIPGNCWQSRYFQAAIDSPKFGKRDEYVFVWSPRSVEFLDEEPAAMTLSWSRYDAGEHVPESDRKELEDLLKLSERGTTTFRKGDEFSTGYRLYKVLNVVPAGDLPGGGHCEGWVELDEIERPATDESAAVKDERRVPVEGINGVRNR